MNIPNSAKYVLGGILITPLLPLMYIHGRSIRSKVPKLPEANEPGGYVDTGSADEIKIIYIGESTIAGVGVGNHQEGFTGTLSVEMAAETGKNVNWKVYAKSGYNARNVHHEILPQIEEKKADLIIIGLGGNDAFELNSPWRWKKDIHKIVLSLQEKFGNTKVVFINMPPIKDFPAFTRLIQFSIGRLVEILGNELSKAIEKYAHVFYNEEIISLHKWSALYGSAGLSYFSDGVHPSAITYQVWARHTVAYIRNNNIL